VRGHCWRRKLLPRVRIEVSRDDLGECRSQIEVRVPTGSNQV
jgi:hypothetical protein